MCISVKAPEDVRAQIDTFKALSDETRIRILKVLEVRELCVCEVMQALDISQSRASRQLGILKRAGLVVDRRDGPWRLYSINWQEMGRFESALVQMLGKWLQGDEAILRDRERLRDAVRVGPGCLRR